MKCIKGKYHSEYLIPVLCNDILFIYICMSELHHVNLCQILSNPVFSVDKRVASFSYLNYIVDHKKKIVTLKSTCRCDIVDVTL